MEGGRSRMRQRLRKALPQLLAVLAVCVTLGWQEACAQTPILSAIDPASAIQGQTLQITFRGKNFVPGPTSVAINPSTGVTISAVNVTNTAQLTATFAIAANASLGERLVTVTAGNG